MPKAKSSGVLRLSDAQYGLWKSSPPKSFQWPAWNKKSFSLSRNGRCSDIRIILTKLMLSNHPWISTWKLMNLSNFFIFQEESTIQILRLCIVCFQRIDITITYNSIQYIIYTYRRLWSNAFFFICARIEQSKSVATILKTLPSNVCKKGAK